MAFIERNAGVIVGVYANRQPGRADEELADNAPEVTAFRSRVAAPPKDAQPLTAAETLNLINKYDTKKGPLTAADLPDRVKVS